MKSFLESEAGLDALFQYATEGILITNDAGDIIRVNPSCNKLFGYDKDELLHQKVEVLIPKKFAHNHTQDREQYRIKPHTRKLDSGLNLYGLKKSGDEFPLEISLSPFTNEYGSFIIAFIVDITHRKLAESALLNHTELLEKEVANRTEILEKTILELGKTKTDLKNALEKEKELSDLKSRFITTASHEFRTPLTTMQSSVALVKKYCETGDTENQLKHLDKIKKNINLLNDMLNDFLSLNKFDEDFSKSYPIEINLKSFITEFISELGHLLSEKQVCAMEYAGEELVFVDDKILKSALFILASNAIKYSLENGTILIKTSVSKTNIEIIVKDNGIGILEVDKKHIFERFFRGSNAAYIQGTGLGLTIVQKYVQQMNASLSFESDLNKGTKFTLTIPQKT